MPHGLVAIIDALGFKGIWNAHGPEPVLEKMRRFQDSVEGLVSPPDEVETKSSESVPELVDETTGSVVSFHFTNQVLFLSDTVFVGTGLDRRISPGPRSSKPSETFERNVNKGLSEIADEHQEAVLFGPLLVLHLTTVIRSITTMLRDDPALTCRGCIAAGEFEVARNFLVGRAVDEAAELAPLADGAFVWLAPSATERYRKIRDKASYQQSAQLMTANPMLIEHMMPMKDGRFLDCPVVNPFALSRPEDRTVLWERLQQTFNSVRLEVVIKKQNTARFLRAAIAEE